MAGGGGGRETKLSVFSVLTLTYLQVSSTGGNPTLRQATCTQQQRSHGTGLTPPWRAALGLGRSCYVMFVEFGHAISSLWSHVLCLTSLNISIYLAEVNLYLQIFPITDSASASEAKQLPAWHLIRISRRDFQLNANTFGHFAWYSRVRHTTLVLCLHHPYATAATLIHIFWKFPLSAGISSAPDFLSPLSHWLLLTN